MTTNRVDPAFGHWLAGMTDGEGSFVISRDPRGIFRCTFQMGLRLDDRPILNECCSRVGLGAVHEQLGRLAVWVVGRKVEVEILVQLFRRYPLRAKKAKDFEVWARAVELWNGEDAAESKAIKFMRLKLELEAGRKFPPEPAAEPETVQCFHCETDLLRGTNRCPACHTTPAKHQRRQAIQALWRDGASLKQIGAELDLSIDALQYEIQDARRRGYDIPRRNTGFSC